MNRAKRRELAKRINTPQKLEKIVEETTRERTAEIVKEYRQKIIDYTEVMVVITAYVLNLEGYGKKRLPKIINRILMNIDSFRTGHLTPDDYLIIRKEMEKLGIKTGE